MKCPRPSCREASTLLSADKGRHGSVQRRYRCQGGHHFTTLETIQPNEKSVEYYTLMSALRSIRERFRMVKESRRA